MIRPVLTQRFDARLFKDILVYQLVVFAVLCFLLSPSPIYAELKAMSSDELKSSTGQAGLTSFTMSESTARMFLDIHMETYTVINSLQSGFDPNWDLQWNNISLGNSEDDPLIIDGLVLIADFDNTSAPNPILERIVIGSNRLQGSLTADMASYSGMYNNALVGGTGTPVSLSRTAISPSPTTFNFNSVSNPTGDMGLFFILNLNGTNAGLQVVAGYNEKTIPDGPQGHWWDAP